MRENKTISHTTTIWKIGPLRFDCTKQKCLVYQYLDEEAILDLHYLRSPGPTLLVLHVDGTHQSLPFRWDGAGKDRSCPDLSVCLTLTKLRTRFVQRGRTDDRKDTKSYRDQIHQPECIHVRILDC